MFVENVGFQVPPTTLQVQSLWRTGPWICISNKSLEPPWFWPTVRLRTTCLRQRPEEMHIVFESHEFQSWSLSRAEVRKARQVGVGHGDECVQSIVGWLLLSVAKGQCGFQMGQGSL